MIKHRATAGTMLNQQTKKAPDPHISRIRGFNILSQKLIESAGKTQYNEPNRSTIQISIQVMFSRPVSPMYKIGRQQPRVWRPKVAVKLALKLF
ncbi:MAG: hypothetical protein ABF621_25225 [Paenibacillus polymyxa]